MSRTWSFACITLALLFTASCITKLPPRPAVPTHIPDLTKGQGPKPAEAKGDWFLHCGKSRGWMWRDDKGKCDQSRQILVTKVPIDSEVRRVLQVGDVILGVNGKYFSKHAVYEFREASLPAKRVEGTFEVILWRKGWDRERRVTLDLSHKPLDFTKGDVRGLAVDWNLGATGARGWVEGQHEESVKARQILITSVEKGSPADGVLQPDDVILGVNGVKFYRDARRALAEAITKAETEAEKGTLLLLRWRRGKTTNVIVKIPVMGSYSKTTPWDCPKTARILKRACDYLIKNDILNRGGVGNGQADMAALALLATGDPKHQELAKGYVYKLLGAMEQEKGHPPVWGYATWGWSYGNLLMTEYYLLTGDKKVIPAIERYSNLLAKGQSGAGSWGHRMAITNHGPCHGYGSMNQCGTIAWMSLMLAKRCGVSNAETEQAIARGRDYLTTFIDRQPIPYGDHINLRPNAHDDNGKSSSAAVAHAVLGDQNGTRFYSRMTVASYAVRERGHTGSWWSMVWGPLGAARAGKDACGAFLNEMAWLHDLERRWDGGFTYQGKPGVGYGVDPKTGRQKGGREHNNGHWDLTGARILMYCLPRKRLCITGKNVLTAEVPKADIPSVIEAGRPSPEGNRAAATRYDGKPISELLELLGSWSPVARHHAAKSLAKTLNGPNASLLSLLKNKNRFAQYGACQALREMGPRAADAVPQLIELLKAEDQLLQIYAIAALGETRDRRTVAPLLQMAAADFENDRIGIMQRMVSRALFIKGSLLQESIGDVDRELLYPAVRGILRCYGGHERSMMADVVLKKLTFEELQPLWPVLIPALRKVAPTGVMFASGVRMTIAGILAENKVEEGMDLLLEYMKLQKPHGSGGGRNKQIMDLLRQYGAAAQPMLPKMEEYIKFLEIERPWDDIGQPPWDRFYKGQIPHVKEAMEVIKASKEEPKLISIKPYLKEQK